MLVAPLQGDLLHTVVIETVLQWISPGVAVGPLAALYA
jgi:hypothetical protein